MTPSREALETLMEHAPKPEWIEHAGKMVLPPEERDEFMEHVQAYTEAYEQAEEVLDE